MPNDLVYKHSKRYYPRRHGAGWRGNNILQNVHIIMKKANYTDRSLSTMQFQFLLHNITNVQTRRTKFINHKFIHTI